MIFYLTDIRSNIHRIDKPLKIKLRSDFDTPADSLYLKSAVFENMPELCFIRAEHNGETVFEGIIDEEIYSADEKGLTLEISARSRAAVLLDNEAIPAVYFMPSFKDIFEMHAKSYGVKGYIGNARCKGSFTVKKGMSEWSVIDSFAKNIMGTVPRISPDMILIADYSKSDKSHTISNQLNCAVRFSYAKLKNMRYGIVSSVAAKLESLDGYNAVIVNEAAAQRKIVSRRLINLSNLPEWEKEFKAKRIIEKSENESFTLSVKIPSYRNFSVNDRVCFYDGVLGDFDNLKVWSTQYVSDEKEQYVLLELRRG